MANPKIAVPSAADMGYAGVLLAASHPPRARADWTELGEHRLKLTILNGLEVETVTRSFAFPSDSALPLHADLSLVTVKATRPGGGRRRRARTAASCRDRPSERGCNADLLRSMLPGRPVVLAGLVSFKLFHRCQGRFHLRTAGDLVIDAGDAATMEALAVPNLHVRAASDIECIIFGKLVIDFNNAVNASSGLTLHKRTHQSAAGSPKLESAEVLPHRR